MLLLPASLAAQTESAERTAVAYAVVLAGTLNVRTTPQLDADVAATVVRGDTLCVLSHSDDWLEVRTREAAPKPSAKQEGFVSRGFVSERRVGLGALNEMGCGF